MAENQETSKKITVTVKTPKEKQTVEVDEDAEIKDVSIFPYLPCEMSNFASMHFDDASKFLIYFAYIKLSSSKIWWLRNLMLNLSNYVLFLRVK